MSGVGKIGGYGLAGCVIILCHPREQTVSQYEIFSILLYIGNIKKLAIIAVILAKAGIQGINH